MKKFKTFISLLLALAMLSALAPTVAFGASTLAKSGQCGENVTWTYSSGTLTISGTGDMYDYDASNESPFRESGVKEVVIEDGVTSVGSYSFLNCWDITSVTIADSVTSIGDKAFYGCWYLEDLSLPKELRAIGESAFETCYNLESIDIPAKVTKIGAEAFRRCYEFHLAKHIDYVGPGLQSISIPLSVTEIGDGAFDKCEQLEDVYYAGSKSDKNKISIGDDNDYLEDASWHYNSAKAAQPEESNSDELVYYTVTFEGCGVAQIAPQLVEQYGCATEPTADMSREGYTFLGWYNGNSKHNFETSLIKSDITLTPKWEDEEKVYRNSKQGLYYSKVISKSGLTQDYYITLTGSGNTLSFSKSGTYDFIASAEWSFPSGIAGEAKHNTAIVYATKAGIYDIWLAMVSTYTHIAYDAYNRPYNNTVASNDSCHFYVHAFDEISNITVPSSMNMSVGESRVLNFSTTPSGNYARQASGFTWSSSDTDVVTIRSDGVLTAVGAGTATITLVTTSANPVKATCTVTVTQGGTSTQVSTSTSGSSSSAGISVTLNGSKITFDQEPVIIDGRTMVPLRAIFEALGASVAWDNSSQTVVAIKDGKIVQMTIGQAAMYVNGEAKSLDTPPQLINSRTLVPARAVAEAFGCSVDWNSETRTVVISM